MKKWLAGIFVFAFSLTFTAFALADTVGDTGTCVDSISDGYEWCYATFYFGDGDSGGLDDYDFNWYTLWKATSSSTLFLDYANFYTSGVASGNDDYLDYQQFVWPYQEDGSCVGQKMYQMSCYSDYNRSLEEISVYSPYARGLIGVWDPENGIMHQFEIKFKPTS